MISHIVFYHDPCIDGFTSAFLAAKALQTADNSPHLVPIKYGDVRCVEDLQRLVGSEGYKNKVVYILDFSFPKPVMDWLFDNANFVVWLDHHKTAFEMYAQPADHFWQLSEDKRFIWLDPNASGAMLTWRYFFYPEKTLPDLIRVVDDYDRWQFRLADTKEANAFIKSQPRTFAAWNDMLKMSSCEMATNGRVIQKYEEALVAQMLEAPDAVHSITLAASTAEGLAINGPAHLSSALGHALCEESETFGAVWQYDGVSRIKVSLRSEGDFDVSEIAKMYGGGGHKNAAGFSIDVEPFFFNLLDLPPSGE